MIPNQIRQGDSLSWTESEADYPASIGWVVHYVLVNADNRVAFNSSADGDDHDFSITTAATSGWNQGKYTYQRYVTDGTDRHTLQNGVVEIKPDFTTASDQRSHAEKTLDAIEAVIEERATLDQENYTIQGRSLSRMNISDLLKFRDVYRTEVARAKNAERIAKGLGTRQKIRVRF